MAKKIIWGETPHKANLLLQIILHFNLYISSLWVVFCGYFLANNISTFNEIQTLLSTFGFCITTPAECLRLYLGYSGNLRGNVSDLAGFWIITSLIQFPIHIYFSFNLSETNSIFLKFLQYILLIFIVFGIPIGGYASRKLSIHQAQLYQMKLLYFKSCEKNKNQ